MRRREGMALGRVLAARLSEIAALAQRAEAAPGRKPEAIKARLAEQVAALLEARALRCGPAAPGSDPDRRQGRRARGARSAGGACAQARKLIAAGGPIGRRLDFLAQELNRESNTLCAKANDVELTNIGLGAQGRGRAVPRAGAEPGIAHGERRAESEATDRPPRPDAGAVLAFGRRQDDAFAHAAQAGSQASNCRSR